jgi:glucose/arabinose dehydrogenase
MNRSRLLSIFLVPFVFMACGWDPFASDKEQAGATSEGDVDAGSTCTLVDPGIGPKGTVAVRAENLVSGLEVPWGVAFLPNGDWLITERPGRVRLLRGGQVAANPVVTIPLGSSSGGGLLGITVHPAFATNKFFYVYVTSNEGGTTKHTVSRWKLSTTGFSATFDKTIFEHIPAAPAHEGGRIRFGPDGMLYIGMGDSLEPGLSQDPTSPVGKVLRLTPDGDVPAGNPIEGNPVFLSGLRNPQGFDWLNANTLAVVDQGPSGELGRSAHDEINVVTAGANLGWPTIFGCEAQEGLVTPALNWASTASPPGGIALYTGTAIPEWQGSVLVGILGAKHLHRVKFDPPGSSRVGLHEVYFEGDPPNGLGRLRETIMGPDGHLYVTTSNCDGEGICPPEKDRIVRIRK